MSSQCSALLAAGHEELRGALREVVDLHAPFQLAARRAGGCIPGLEAGSRSRYLRSIGSTFDWRRIALEAPPHDEQALHRGDVRPCTARIQSAMRTWLMIRPPPSTSTLSARVNRPSVRSKPIELGAGAHVAHQDRARQRREAEHDLLLLSRAGRSRTRGPRAPPPRTAGRASSRRRRRTLEARPGSRAPARRPAGRAR